MPNINTLILTICLVLFVLFFINSYSSSRAFSLSDSYCFYKEYYVTKDGRVMDPQKNHITTSEGQSYMLLKSFLMDDRRTFDLILTWSKNNLQRKDYLFSWLWGENKNGDYKILDENSASDADIDIAFSLILAYEKWGEKAYLDKAMLIMNSIWEKEVKEINGIPILMPGQIQACCERVEINPSYFSPYAFKLFAKYDKMHNWQALVDSSYDLLNEVISITKTGLPPDWFVIQDGVIVLEKDKSNFSYDAIRVFPRVFLDYKITGDKRALPILKKSQFFTNNWNNSKTFYTNFKPDGEMGGNDKFIGSIAILLPVINMYDEKAAFDIYTSEIRPYFGKKLYWDNKKEYYGQNLLWFGCYLYKNFK